MRLLPGPGVVQVVLELLLGGQLEGDRPVLGDAVGDDLVDGPLLLDLLRFSLFDVVQRTYTSSPGRSSIRQILMPPCLRPNLRLGLQLAVPWDRATSACL